jgi:hypothetical protein
MVTTGASPSVRVTVSASVAVASAVTRRHRQHVLTRLQCNGGDGPSRRAAPCPNRSTVGHVTCVTPKVSLAVPLSASVPWRRRNVAAAVGPRSQWSAQCRRSLPR